MSIGFNNNDDRGELAYWVGKKYWMHPNSFTKCSRAKAHQLHIAAEIITAIVLIIGGIKETY